jgi:hypothetical protein
MDLPILASRVEAKLQLIAEREKMQKKLSKQQKKRH